MDYEEDYDQAAEIARAEKTYILSLPVSKIIQNAPTEITAKRAWVAAQLSSGLDELIQYLETEILPHYPIEITQRLDGNGQVFVIAEGKAVEALYTIPNCHVSGNRMDFIALENSGTPDKPAP